MEAKIASVGTGWSTVTDSAQGSARFKTFRVSDQRAISPSTTTVSVEESEFGLGVTIQTEVGKVTAFLNSSPMVLVLDSGRLVCLSRFYIGGDAECLPKHGGCAGFTVVFARIGDFAPRMMAFSLVRVSDYRLFASFVDDVSSVPKGILSHEDQQALVAQARKARDSLKDFDV